MSTSLCSLVYLVLSVDAEAVKARFSTVTPVRLIGAFVILMALLLTVKWVSTILGALGAGISPSHKELVVLPVLHLPCGTDSMKFTGCLPRATQRATSGLHHSLG
jgi:hypothetical protein